jgi:hypothetical protein
MASSYLYSFYIDDGYDYTVFFAAIDCSVLKYLKISDRRSAQVRPAPASGATLAARRKAPPITAFILGGPPIHAALEKLPPRS